MRTLAPPLATLREAASLLAGPHRGVEAVLAAQRSRLRALVGHARQRSPYYRERYAELGRHWELEHLPTTRKPDLMARFDEWVCDPDVTLRAVEAHLADPNRVGTRLHGRYVAVTTSGVTGRRGIFVHDPRAVAAYTALVLTRGAPGWSAAEGKDIAKRGVRVAALVATGGHFAAAAMGRMIQDRVPGGKSRMRVFSVLSDTDSLIAQLNAYDPTILFGYPSAIALLAGEKDADRLTISPRLVLTGGESLAAPDRLHIIESFGCTIRNVYATSEFPLIALECREGRMHGNADRVIVEPVDDKERPAPPGHPGHTTLITNLVNRVQPIIRYDIGDRTTLVDERCPCGSTLPVLRIEGRRDDTLHFPGTSKRDVAILPLALATIIEETPGVAAFQAYETSGDTLHVRLEAPGDRDLVWSRAAANVRRFLEAQGAASVKVELDDEPPRRDPRTGKLRQVWRVS